MISTNKGCVEHPLPGQNTQHSGMEINLESSILSNAKINNFVTGTKSSLEPMQNMGC